MTLSLSISNIFHFFACLEIFKENVIVNEHTKKISREKWKLKKKKEETLDLKNTITETKHLPNEHNNKLEIAGEESVNLKLN